MPKCTKFIIETTDHEFIEIMAPSKENALSRIKAKVLRVYEQLSFNF